jgi:SlyX protein
MEKRFIDLEIRFSHQDDFLSQLNDVVTEQQLRIERLEKAILDLKKDVQTENGVDSRRSLLDEKPPHY